MRSTLSPQPTGPMDNRPSWRTRPLLWTSAEIAIAAMTTRMKRSEPRNMVAPVAPDDNAAMAPWQGEHEEL